MCNVALVAAGVNYRFPKKSSTVSNHNGFQERACSGLSSLPVCVKCSRVFPSDTEVKVCGACQTELYKTSSNVPQKIYMYNSVTTTIRNFMVRPGFTESLVKWQSREKVPGRYMDINNGAVWKTLKTGPANPVPNAAFIWSHLPHHSKSTKRST
ncbi:hypothetical protein G6F56_013890 [Rhizopus delemar]|nr:hypothetical protein G6F56_013890 [Rhizopus delemar]